MFPLKMRMICLAAGAVSALCVSAHPGAKKVIATGWDTLRVSPEEVLANASKFVASGIDGVNLKFTTHTGSGEKLESSAIFSGVEFKYEDVKSYVPVFRKIASAPGLAESLLTVWWTPREGQRLRWNDDSGWRLVARNMGVMSKLAREGGLKGLFLDWEDYSKVGQFTRKDEDPPLEETMRLARRRGREVGGAVFKEFPDLVFFSYWWLCAESHIATLNAEEQAYALKKSVWTAFVDGMFDVMPDGVKMIDGREHYHLESFRRDFYRHSSLIQTSCQSLLSPENRAKYRRAISVSFGHYLDMYTNDESAGHWYYGPEGGSRLEHFRRNLEQSFCAATEYVWIYGEKGLFVPFADCSNGWIGRQQTWEAKLPGFLEVLKKTKRACSLVKPDSGNGKKNASASARRTNLSSRRVNAADRRKKAAAETQGEWPRKFIAVGASIRSTKPKDLLKQAPELARVGIDGVAVSLNTSDSWGNKIGSEGIGSPVKYTVARLSPFLADLRAMSKHDGLKESLVYINWNLKDKNRLPWSSEKRWATFAHNMGMMAKLTRTSGLKGLFIDVGDLNEGHQFTVIGSENNYDFLVREARRRGRAVGKAVFSAFPDIVLFSTAWFSSEAHLADPSDESAEMRLKKSGSLWPAFVNGIIAEMPATARLVDGGGTAAHDAGKGDYDKGASDLFAVSHMLVDEANAAKFFTSLSPASGDRLARYKDVSSEHSFWRNLSQGASVSTEYVWIDVGEDSLAGEGASSLDERVPGLRDVICQVKDERAWIRQYLKEKGASANDLVPDPTTACGISEGYFAYIERNRRDVAKIESDRTVGEGDSVSFRMTNCGLHGTLMFRVQDVSPNDFYIVQFSTKGYPVSAKVSWREDSDFRWNVPSVNLPVAGENAAGWRTASRIVRAPDMEGYNEMYLMIDMRGCKEGDCSWIDNVHVYKMK